MSAEGPDLATNVVKELSLIKERVAFLEEENALLKRIDRHAAAFAPPEHLPYSPLQRSRLRQTSRYKHIHAPTTNTHIIDAGRHSVLPSSTHLLIEHAAAKRSTITTTNTATVQLSAQRRSHPDDLLHPPHAERPLTLHGHPARANALSTPIFAHQRRPSGRNIWVGSEHRSLQVSHELLGAALPDAVRGFPVAIFAKYEDNVNTAVKGVAIAAERLREQGRHVCVEASFRENRNEVTLLVVDVPLPLRHVDKAHAISDDATHKLTSQPDDVLFQSGGVVNKRSYDRGALTVSSQTDYKILGGAIASRVRYSKPTVLRAIGKRAVWAATRAIAVAREYVVETGPYLVFTPRFNSVQLSNRTEPSTVVELCVFAFE